MSFHIQRNFCCTRIYFWRSRINKKRSIPRICGICMGPACIARSKDAAMSSSICFTESWPCSKVQQFGNAKSSWQIFAVWQVHFFSMLQIHVMTLLPPLSHNPCLLDLCAPRMQTIPINLCPVPKFAVQAARRNQAWLRFTGKLWLLHPFGL